eukprot:GFYU01041355.1.p1 GENE.GFYU01041355.1~~GFYU01041355.1.p1  ORF type:complete len:264 (-),score=35.78 GFYU01041355.1:302-1093(-)
MSKKKIKEPEAKAVDELYEVLETLGAGHFSTVKKCVAKETGIEYAMKIVSKQRTSSTKAEESMLEEVHILQDLDHQNIVKLVDVFQSNKKLFIVMELMDGGQLFEDGEGPSVVPEGRSADIMRQVCQAVDYLHDKGIVHRDLKVRAGILALVGSRIRHTSHLTHARNAQRATFHTLHTQPHTATHSHTQPRTVTTVTHNHAQPHMADSVVTGDLVHRFSAGKYSLDESGKQRMCQTRRLWAGEVPRRREPTAFKCGHSTLCCP